MVAHQFNMKKHKVAIWIENGEIQGIRSSVNIDVEVIDAQNDLVPKKVYDWWLDNATADLAGPNARRSKWDAYQTELPFSIY